MDFAGMKRRELQALCKRHGLPAGGTNAALVARLDAALSGGAGAEEEDVAGVAARKGCLKRSAGDAGEAKKVTFAVEESRGRRRRKSRVVWSPVVAKTRGKRADAGSADSAADDGISAKADSNVPVRRSRRNSLTAAEAEEVKEAVTVDSKRKRKGQGIAEDVAVSAQVVASCRVTRRSSLSGTTSLLPPAAEKKRGRGKAADGKNMLVAEEQVAEVQGLPTVAPPTVVESKRSRRKGENCEPDVQNSAKVEVSSRTTRSRLVEAVAMSPTVVHNKRRRKTGDAQPDVELPRNNAPVTRSLRSRVVQVNNSVVDLTHTSQQLENKMQPSRPATRRNQQVASSVEEESQEQVAAPSKAPMLRRSGRNNSDASNANSESNKLRSAPVEAKDSKIDHLLTRHNAKAEDVEKQLIVNEPVRRSKRKSVVSAMLDNEKDLIEEKNPEVRVKRSKRKSIVLVKDIKCAGEEIQNAKGEDATGQPAVKEPARKSLVSSMHEKEEKDLVAEKNPGAHIRRSMRKSIVPVNDIKGVGEDIQNAKGEEVEKQLVVKQPVRRSSRRSVPPDTIENESGFLVAETNDEAHVRESTRKSVLLNMLNKENPDHSKMASNENLQIDKYEDEKQQKTKEPVRRSRRSVATVMPEGKISTIPMRRSTRKSITLNVVEKGSMDHIEKVGREQPGVGRKKPKVREHTDCAVVVVTSGNELQVEVAVQKNLGLQWSTGKSSDHNLADDNERHRGSGKCVSCERVGEEDLKLRKHRSSVEISSSANDSWNKEDFSAHKFRKQQSAQTPSGKDSTCAKYDKPVGTQQASNSTTSKGRSSKRRQTTVSEVMSAKEANDDMVIREATKDAHKVSHDYSKEISSRVQEICQVNATREEFSSGPLLGTALPDDICSAQSVQRVVPGSESGDTAEESLDKSKHPQEQSDIQADDSHLSETRNGEVDQSSSIAELLPRNVSVSEYKPLMGEASGSALPISDINPEIHCDAIVEQSIQATDLGRCPSKGGKGNPLLTNLHSESAADDSICPSLNTAKHAAKGCSSDGRHSSFGLEFLFTEECKESCSRNVKNTSVEVDGGNESITCVTPGFYVGSDCGLEDKDMQCTGFDADKTLDVHQDVAEEEVVAEEKSYDEHVAAKTDLKTKLNGELTGLDMETDCSIAEKNVRLVADNPDAEEATIEVQQADVQEGYSEKPSATPEFKHECGLPEETILHSKNKGCLSIADQSPFGLQSLFLHESIEKSVEYGALASATVHTENGSDELKDCHVKCALEITHVSELFSHQDTDDGSRSVSKNDVFMCTPHQDNGIEGLSKASLEGECVLSVFSVDAKHIKEVTNPEEVSCKGEGSKKLVHSCNLKASYEKQDVNGPADNAYGVSNTVLNALHAPANDSYDACLGSNTEPLNQGHNDRCSEDTEERFASKPGTNDIIENPSAKYSESGLILLPADERSHLQNGQLNSKLEGAEVVESCLNFSKDISSILDDGSVVGSASERTLSGSGLPKDPSIEYNTRHELLGGSSVETFLDGSTTREEKDVSRADTIENPSFTLATPGYKHEGALSEEAVRTMKKYAQTCSLNPRGLLMDLQSMFSKEDIEESDPHDGTAFPSAESPGDESINVKRWVEVHLDSTVSQLESTDLLDELIGHSQTEVLHQGHKDRISEDREEQVASGPCANDIVEAAAAKHMESGAVLLPSEERSNLKDEQVNLKKERSTVMESGFNCNKDVTNTSDNGSVVDIVGQRTPSGLGLPEDYRMDHNLQKESLDGCSVESSLQGSTMFGKKFFSGVAGIIGNPSFSLATPDYKHEGALSEEAVCKMKQYTGRCSADPKHLLMELQSLFLEGSIEKSDLHDDLAFPSAESERNEPTVWHVEQPVDTLVSSEPNTYQGLCQDLSRAEAKESCMSLSVQHNESGGSLSSSHMKDRVTSTQIDLSDDAHLIERNIVVEEGLCEEKEKRKSMSTSDSDILYEKSHSNEYGICQSHGQKHMVEINPNLLSCDSEMLHRDHKEETSEPNEDKIIPNVPENGTSEAAPVEGSESAVMLPFVAGMLEMPDEQLKTKLSDEGEEHSFSCDKDTIGTFCTGSPKKDLFPLPKDCHIDSCQKQEVPDVLSLPKSPEESANYLDGSVSGSGPCQTSGQQCINESSSMQVTSNTQAFHQDHEENYENNEGQITPGIAASGVSEAVQIEKPQWEMDLPPPAGTSALSDEQVNMEVEGHKVGEHSFCYDKDTESLNSKASSLHKDTRKDPPSDLSAPRSPEESTVLQNYYVPGSVGICQSSRQTGIDELRAKLQSFKVSSTVKGSYIAMSAPREKPGNNLSQSAIALLQNRENPPAVKTDHPAKPNPDRSVTKDSSRRALQPISGRPGDH